MYNQLCSACVHTFSIILLFVYVYRKNGRDGNPQFSANTETAHQFQEYTYKKITPCDFCSQVLRGKSILYPIFYDKLVLRVILQT